MTILNSRLIFLSLRQRWLLYLQILTMHFALNRYQRLIKALNLNWFLLLIRTYQGFRCPASSQIHEQLIIRKLVMIYVLQRLHYFYSLWRFVRIQFLLKRQVFFESVEERVVPVFVIWRQSLFQFYQVKLLVRGNSFYV